MPKGIYKRKVKTHCPRGHEFTIENTCLYRDKYKVCKTCAAARYKKHLKSGLTYSHTSNWVRNNKHKRNAHQKVNRYIKSGKIKKENCKICNSEKSVAHHEDYSKHLEIIWLCRLHHRQLHLGKITIK